MSTSIEVGLTSLNVRQASFKSGKKIDYQVSKDPAWGQTEPVVTNMQVEEATVSIAAQVWADAGRPNKITIILSEGAD